MTTKDDKAEKTAIIDALKATDGSRIAAAKKLGWGLRTLHRRIADLHLRTQLKSLAKENKWPDQAAAARKARTRNARDRRMQAAGAAPAPKAPASTESPVPA